jgi:hypothetical protein
MARAQHEFAGNMGGLTKAPSSILTRPADTTPYAAGDLIASSTTAGSIVVPSFAAVRAAGRTSLIRGGRLVSNVTTGWGVLLSIDLFLASAAAAGAPTHTNGDNGAYTIATGAARWLGRMTGTLIQFTDGAAGPLTCSGVNEIPVDFTAEDAYLVYWTLAVGAAMTPTPISGQTFTLYPTLFLD